MPPPEHLPLQVPHFVNNFAPAHQPLKIQLVVATNMTSCLVTQLAQPRESMGWVLQEF